MSVEQVQRVLWAWRERMRDLRRDTAAQELPDREECRRAQPGATLDHPHSQLLAMPLVPQHLEDELLGARAYHASTTKCVFCEVVAHELAAGERVIGSDADTIAFTPFASRVPFESWVMLRRHQPAFDQLDDVALTAVATRLRDTMRRLDGALASPPHTVLLHSAPVGDEESESYDWHLENHPAAAAGAGAGLGRRAAHQPGVAGGGRAGAAGAVHEGAWGARCAECLRCWCVWCGGASVRKVRRGTVHPCTLRHRVYQHLRRLGTRHRRHLPRFLLRLKAATGGRE